MNRRRLVVVPLALGLVGALAGCAFPVPGLQQGGATPTPSAVSVAEAATAFTDTICTFNDAAFAFDQTWSDLDAPLRDVQEAASLSRTEAETAKQQLQAVTWPADIADDLAIIEDYLDQRIGKLDSVLAAGAAEELDEIDFTTPEGVNTAAAEVEAQLQLGSDYCPQPEEPAEEPAADLEISTWSGVDSDGDDTVVILGVEGDAQVTVGTTLYEGDWQLADGLLTVDVATSDNALSFNGFYEPGQTGLSLSGTATNGHTWTVELARI